MSCFDCIGACLGVAIGLAGLGACPALGRGLFGLSPLQTYQLSWRFALLQFVLLVAGWLVGMEVANTTDKWCYRAGTLLVALMAMKMLGRCRENRIRRETPRGDEPAMLLATAFCVKLQPLALGLVLAFLGCRSVVAAILVGLIAGILTVMGIVAGSRRGLQVARGVRSAGGCVLLVVVARAFLSHF